MVIVKAWDKEVGQLVYNGKGSILFKYSEDNLLEFSPIKMRMGNRSVQNFSHIKYQYGLPGLISDNLPGRYGMEYMDRFLFEHLKRKPTILERLKFLGTHTIGALEFHPSEYDTDEYKEIITISNLYKESKNLLDKENKELNNAQAALKTLIAISNSAGGGARAKATVGFNKKDNTISLLRKQDEFPEGYLPVIIKYDDKDISMYPMLDNKYKDASIPTKLEYIYYLFTKQLDITMSECQLLECEGHIHFLTYRFDRIKNQRFHMHSFAGLMHIDPADTTNDYIDLLRCANKLNISSSQIEQIVKLMLFNAIFGNKDDHAANFSFLMNNIGKWAFAPAYDLTYTSNGYHQMYIGVNVLNRISYNKLYEVLKPFNITESFLKENIKKMIDLKHSQLVKKFSEYDIPESFAKHILEDTKAVDELLTKGV